MSGKKYEMPVFSGRTIRQARTYALIFGIVCMFLNITGIRKGMGYLFVPAFAVGLLLSWREKNIMKRCIWNFEEEGVRRNIFGFESYVSYGEMNEALQSRKVKITAAAFEVPRMRGYISFHYEVGNDKAQREVMESYKFLSKALCMKIPPLSLRVIQHMDRSFYYKRDRRNCVLLMIISAVPMIFVAEERLLAGFLFVGLGQLAQYAVLGSLFKGIYFGKKVEKRIQDMFIPYTNVELRKVRVSYSRMILAVILSAAANLCFLFAGWRWMQK